MKKWGDEGATNKFVAGPPDAVPVTVQVPVPISLASRLQKRPQIFPRGAHGPRVYPYHAVFIDNSCLLVQNNIKLWPIVIINSWNNDLCSTDLWHGLIWAGSKFGNMLMNMTALGGMFSLLVQQSSSLQIFKLCKELGPVYLTCICPEAKVI